jgi:hypothetical protein
MKKHVAVIMIRVNAIDVEPMLVVYPTFTKLRAMIDTETAEFVYLPQGMVMLVDEDGISKERDTNILASVTTGRRIFGDALVVSNESIQQIPYV